MSKKLVLLRHKTQNKSIMEQDILRSQAEQHEIDMIDQAIDMSLEDIAAGRVYTQEQAHQMMDEFVKSKIQFAAWKSFGQTKQHLRGNKMERISS